MFRSRYRRIMRSGDIKNKKHFLSYSRATRELAEPQGGVLFFSSHLHSVLSPDLSVPCCSGDNRLCDARDHATTVDVCVGALVVL